MSQAAPSTASAPPVRGPRLAVVIVAYETPELLAACLDSLARAGVVGRDRVIVVDNSRTDGCAEVARQTAGVHLIRNDHNLGYARAVNQGIAAAGAAADFFLILNPDIEVEPEAVNRLVASMAAHPEAGLAGAKLLNPDRSLQLSCRRFYTAGALLLRRTFLGRLFPRHPVLRHHLMLDWDHSSLRNVDWLIGACLLARRAAVEEVGLMDERFFLYFEDVDWCARMHARGWKVLYVPEAVMIHHHRRESARAGLLHPARLSHLASVLRFYEKWSLLLYVLKRNRERLRGAALVVGDLLAINAAFLLAFGARKLLAPHFFTKPLFPIADYWQFLLVFNAATLVALRRFGLYRRSTTDEPREIALRVTQSILVSALAVLVSTFLLYIRAYSRFVILLTVPLAVALVVGARLGLRRFLDRMAARGLGVRRVLVAGDRELGGWLASRLRASENPRFEVVGFLEPDSPLLVADGRAANRLRALCLAERVQELIIADRTGEFAALLGEVAPLAEEGVRVRLLGPWAGAFPAGSRIEVVAGVDLLAPPPPSRRPG